MTPKVSIIIPTYNRARLLETTLNSVFSQTYENYEVLVIDDGSTDDTEKVLKKFKKIRYFKKKNGGVSSARNLGIKNSKGNLIAFLDSDDLWHEKKLEKTVKKFKNSNIALVYTNYLLFAKDDCAKKEIKVPFYGKKTYEKLLLGNFIPNSSVVIRKKVLKKTGLFYEGFNCKASYEDWDLWLRITKMRCTGMVTEPLLFYRRHNSNTLTGSSFRELKKDLFLVLKRAFERDKSINWFLKRRAIAGIFRLLGSKYFYGSDLKSAKINYLKSFIFNPFDFETVIFLIKSLLPIELTKLLRKIKNYF
ncbi:glycosyltransferase [Candidatus Woesearchaeota archaeon]|nr:glycosyltransferase [Candidatus Woesearchaeota archaeon]